MICFSVEEAIRDTVIWRHNYSIRSIGLGDEELRIFKGLTYVSPRVDKHDRSIIYVKLKSLNKSLSPDSSVRLVMNAVER